MNLITYIEQHMKWSRATFGRASSTVRLTSHIEKECQEIRDKPQDLEEWIDVIILAIDGAWRAGHTAEAIAEMLVRKQTINQARTFILPEDPDQPAEHDRRAEQGATR